MISLLNSFVLNKIELSPTSIEKEFFLKNATKNKFYAMVLPRFDERVKRLKSSY